uniref:Fe2OG dioxygenase domain-containing protein n=2 Tax=Chrysotila carterae TaxID=13221 RepID=A0A6S9Z8D0_CHRCT
MEPFQVLRYERGQFYKTHHDQNAASFTPQGPRVYTFYMYLSTPESGGGTRFNDLGVTVPAVKGSAVLWPSVQSDDPTRDEPFTNHESVSVERGVKYGANIWVHNFDYRTPASKNCVLTHMNTHG